MRCVGLRQMEWRSVRCSQPTKQLSWSPCLEAAARIRLHVMRWLADVSCVCPTCPHPQGGYYQPAPQQQYSQQYPQYQVGRGV